MVRRATGTKSGKDTTGSLGLEQKLWAAADALRNNMDAAEYKPDALGLIDPAAERLRRLRTHRESARLETHRDEPHSKGIRE